MAPARRLLGVLLLLLAASLPAGKAAGVLLLLLAASLPAVCLADHSQPVVYKNNTALHATRALTRKKCWTYPTKTAKDLVSLESLEKNNLTLSFGPIIQQTGPNSVTPKALTNSTMERPDNHAQPTFLPSETPPTTDSSLLEIGITNSSAEDTVISQTPFTILNEALSKNDELLNSLSHAQVASPVSSSDSVYDSLVQRETVAVESLPHTFSSSSLDMNVNSLTTIYGQTAAPVKSMSFLPDTTVLPFSQDVLLNPTYTLEEVEHYTSSGATFAAIESTSSPVFLPFEESTAIFPLVLSMQSSDIKPATTTTMLSTSERSSQADSSVGMDSIAVKDVDFSSYFVVEELANAISASSTVSAFFSTSLPFISSSVLYNEGLVDPNLLFTSFVILEIASSTSPYLPDTSKMSSRTDIYTDFLSPVPSVRPRTSCAHCDYTLVPQVLSTESMQQDFGSGDYFETSSLTPSLAGSFTLLKTLSSIPDDFSSEIFYTPFPSRPVVSLSSHLMEESESTVPFSNIGTSVSHSIFAVVSSADIQPPLETRLDLATLNFSFPDTESYYLTPSLTLQLSSEIVSIDLPPFETSTDMTVSTAAFEQTSLLEAPAFKHSESVYYFSTISASNSVEETVELSDLVLSLMSTWSLLETSSLSSLTHNISSDSLVPFFPEGMQTMLATSEFFATHSREISSVSSATESPNIDISLIPPWQTSSLLFPVSYTPKTSSAEDWTTLDFYSPTPLFSEVTSVLTSAHETFFTSTSTEATSLSLSETSLFSFPSSSPTIESPISTLPFLTSSSAIDETLLASSLTFSQPTPTFTLSLPNVSSFQASSNVLGLINPTQVASASSETITGFFPLTSSLNTQPTTTLGTNIVASPTISTAASSSVIIIPPILPSTPPSPSTSSSVPPPTWPPASSSTSQTLKSTLATSPPIPSTSSKAPPVNASSATIPTEGTTKATTTGRSTTHIVSTTAHTTEAITSKSTVVSTAIPTVLSPPTVMTTRQPLVCDINATDDYLVTAVLAHAVVVESLKLSIEDLLSGQFNRSVELELYNIFPAFTFLVISGPFVYTAIAVTNAIRVSTLHCGTSPAILSIQPSFIAPESKYQVQTVLQFVPRNMEIGFCNFTQKLERGLAVAFAEVRRLRQETDDFTIQILNVTIGATRTLLRKGPVNIIFAVRDGAGFLNGSDVSNLLRNLSTVEFSFYLGFPVMQLAEPFYYPQLNTSQLLKDSWLRTVLLGVNDHKIQEDVFQAEMERKLALLISEALVQGRRWKRASNAGSNTVQIVNVSRLEGSDNPVELIYFVEDEYGERLGAAKAADLINVVNIQKAAIILGYRVQGVLAQPLNMVQEAPKDSQNLYIIVGVAVPVALVMVILVILYWKLCRTDKLEFQPDTMSNIQQRQKLQAPTVKGFDFAKQHLGQHNKDDVLIIHEPAPLPVPVKDNTPSENGDVPTPKTKSSSKPSKAIRHRGRVTPSDAGSIASGQSSGKESAEETINAPIPLQESKPRKMGKISALQSTNGNEQHSTAAIFEHVDRVSHSSELSRHFPSKIQLIAMQPIAARPMHSFVISDRVAETNKINKEIQTALRHKSEIEHHRNKIRLRAKRKGHYEFPVVDLVGLTDTRERHKMYRKAQMQIDRILDPGGSGPPVYIESRKSSRSKRSPKQRKRHQINGSPPDADRDRLITTDSDGTYKRPPGVSNSAYISDADLVVEPPTPSSCTDLAKFPGSSLHALHSTQYLPPQPSIEEARQTMHSLLDDAFALVAPTSQTIGPTATTLPGSTMGQSITSPPIRAERETTHWGSSYSQPQAINTPFARYVEFGVSPTSVPSLLPRHGYGPGFAPSIEQANQDHQHHLQPEMNYSNRGMYQEEIPSVARPRPIGGTAGPSQIQHLTQVGIASRMGAQLAELPITRAGPMQPGVPSWPAYMDESYPHSRDKVLGHQDYPNTPMFHVPRTSGRQPSAPPAHLQLSSHQGPGMYYPGGSTEDLQPGHTSASLIKAIREELLRLSQKQTAVQNYHS